MHPLIRIFPRELVNWLYRDAVAAAVIEFIRMNYTESDLTVIFYALCFWVEYVPVIGPGTNKEPVPPPMFWSLIFSH